MRRGYFTTQTSFVNSTSHRGILTRARQRSCAGRRWPFVPTAFLDKRTLFSVFVTTCWMLKMMEWLILRDLMVVAILFRVWEWDIQNPGGNTDFHPFKLTLDRFVSLCNKCLKLSAWYPFGICKRLGWWSLPLRWRTKLLACLQGACDDVFLLHQFAFELWFERIAVFKDFG